jgi:hypothetical protein
MLARCYDEALPSYRNYGGRGITVCDRWRNSFEAFALDMGKKPDENYSLDRVNNNLGYSPENCKWSSASEQITNRRKLKSNTTGETGVIGVRGGRFAAKYNEGGVTYHLGRFDSVEDAATYRNTFLTLWALDKEAALKMTERRPRYDSSTGVIGITKNEDGYLIRKTVNKERKYLGFRKTFEEALELWNEHN